MKFNVKRVMMILVLPMAIGLTSCGKKNDEKVDDNKEVAEDQNDEKFDKAAEDDAEFVVDALSSNYAEVALAELAVQRATDPEVKEIATMLVTQHTDVINKLKTFADAKNISVPTGESEKAQDKQEDLADAKSFDKKWCAKMKDMHDKSVKKFEDASTSLADADLRNLAVETLPVIKTHRDKLEACHDRLK